jgi:hypothetical protein
MEWHSGNDRLVASLKEKKKTGGFVLQAYFMKQHVPKDCSGKCVHVCS